MHNTKISSLIFCTLLLSFMSLFIGASELSFSQVFATLLGETGQNSELDFIVNQYRLPRAVLAIGVGAGLGLSGILVQGVIRNPLASPDLMGISAGAGLAATLLMIVLPDVPVHYLSIAALLGGFAAAFIILGISYASKPTPARLALIGIAISAFLSSGIDFLMIVNPIEINTAMVWLTGSLWGRNWEQVPYIWLTLVAVIPLSFWLAWRLDILGLGEDSATSLGVRPNKIQLYALICAVIVASISVSICGTISFIGLLAPHLARMLFGHNHKLLVPSAALIGGLMVLLSDILARGINPPLELPAGVLTSLIGAPYFIFLLQRYKGW